MPEKILEGGPVIDTRSGRATSLQVPDHRLVLTFDDGPDPEWTPKVLDVLKKHHAHAVFFVTGTMASRYPDLVRAHGRRGPRDRRCTPSTTPTSSYQSKKRIDWELTQNQLALAGAAGIRTSLFRPPYSSFADAMDDKSWPVTAVHRHAAATSPSSTTPTARTGSGPASTRSSATPRPKNGKGAIVLMHDSGGDRRQTVQALDRFLPEHAATRATRSTTSPRPWTRPARTPRSPAPELWKGKAWSSWSRPPSDITDVLVVGLAVIGVLVFARFGLMLLLSAHPRPPGAPRGLRWGAAGHRAGVGARARRTTRPSASQSTVRSLMASDHPIEVIVVDDGSTRRHRRHRRGDGPARTSASYASSTRASPPRSTTVSRNARHDLVVMMDGDTVFEPATVRELVQPFADPTRRARSPATPRSATGTP